MLVDYESESEGEEGADKEEKKDATTSAQTATSSPATTSEAKKSEQSAPLSSALPLPSFGKKSPSRPPAEVPDWLAESQACGKCGKDLQPGANFCAGCGTKVGGEDKEKGKKKKKHKKKKDKKMKIDLPAANFTLPDALLGKEENIIEEERTEKTDPSLRYNAVAPPESLNADLTEEERFKLRPVLSLARTKEKDAAKQHRSRMNAINRDSKAEASKATGTRTMFSMTPRQVGSRPNTSTEDLEGWGLKKRKLSENNSSAPGSSSGT